MEPFTKALEIVARIMRDGADTHPDNDWIRRSPEYHLGRAEEHWRLWRDGDQAAGPCVQELLPRSDAQRASQSQAQSIMINFACKSDCSCSPRAGRRFPHHSW